MKNKHSLGQNWLKDRPTLDLIANLVATSQEADTTCVEIGPGLGTLTSSLFKHFNQIIAIELDQSLAHNLPKSFPGKNLKVINEDILKFDFSSIKAPFVITGNIPYYITTPIIKKLLTIDPKPAKIVLLVQKEVAEKVCPIDAGLKNSSLSLLVENYAEASLGPIVPRDLFFPVPKVDSRIITLVPRLEPYSSDQGILDFIHYSFSNPRKKLSANLATSFSLPKAEAEKALSSLGLSPNSRPADLSFDEYATLAKMLQKR